MLEVHHPNDLGDQVVVDQFDDTFTLVSEPSGALVVMTRGEKVKALYAPGCWLKAYSR